MTIAYWVWKLDKRLFTRSSLALWASGLLKTRFWIWSDTLLMAMYAMLKPDSRSEAFFSTKSYGKFSQHLRSEEHTSELQSLTRNSSAVFRLKKQTRNTI